MAKLSKQQWDLIARKHLVDGISMCALARKYGVNESTIRRKLYPKNAGEKPNENPLVELAKDRLKLEEEMRKNTDSVYHLPIQEQMIVGDIYTKLASVSMIAVCVAEAEAKSAQKMSAIKSLQIMKLDPENPDAATVAMIRVLGDVVNDSIKPAVDLIKANKETLNRKDENEIDNFVKQVTGNVMGITYNALDDDND